MVGLGLVGSGFGLGRVRVSRNVRKWPVVGTEVGLYVVGKEMGRDGSDLMVTGAGPGIYGCIGMAKRGSVHGSGVIGAVVAGFGRCTGLCCIWQVHRPPGHVASAQTCCQECITLNPVSI